jgi:hypothetical protein
MKKRNAFLMMCLFTLSLTTKAQDIVWDYATDAQGWHDLGAGRDVTATWDNGALKMTYFENSPGSGPQLWFAAVQVEKEFDAGNYPYLEISYRTVNWPTILPVKCLVQFMNSADKPVYSYADLDPTKNSVSIDIAALDPGWGGKYTGIMKTVYLEIPHNGAVAANPATDWFNATTLIDKVVLTNNQTISKKVAHWSFDTNYTDDIGNISGAANGNPVISAASAKIGTGALVLDGVGSYLRMAANPVFSSQDITYSFWMKTPVGGQTHPGAARIFSTPSSTGFEIGILNGNLSFLADGSWQNFVNGWPNNTWTQVTIVVSGKEVTCYKNGVQSGATLTSSSQVRTGDFLLGSNGGESVIASIDEFSIYNYALSKAEVEGEAGKEPDKMLGYWSFDADLADSTAINTLTSLGSTKVIDKNEFKKGGGAFRFNGIDDRLKMTDIYSSNKKEFTYSYWLKTDAAGAGTGAPRMISHNNNAFELAFLNGNISCFAKNWIDYKYQVKNDAWNQFVWSYDGANLKLYINGIYRGSKAIDSIGGLGDLYIGGSSAGGDYLKGCIDELKIYNYALTLNEIRDPDTYEKPSVPEYAKLKTESMFSINSNFKNPDMLYAPYIFWFWDEPLDPAIYPQKPGNMAAKMLEQGLNPGYPHGRICMTEILGYQDGGSNVANRPADFVVTKSLPQPEWLSEKWFDAYGEALNSTVKGGGRMGYDDEYMWPVGHAAGRVNQKHPELEGSSLQWELQDVAGGQTIAVPTSFFSVAGKMSVLPDYNSAPDYVHASWIWNQSATLPAYYFRKKFARNAGTISSAKITITCDNSYKLYVNGQLVGSDLSWWTVEEYNVSSKLTSGENVIAVEGGGDTGVDALLCELLITFSDGSTQRISSDGLWKVHAVSESNWNTVSYDDTSWILATVLGPGGMSPWGLTQAKVPYLKATIATNTLQVISDGTAVNWTVPGTSADKWRIYTFKKVASGLNLLDKRASDAFIEIAHQPYVDHFGDKMGTTITGAFCDTEGSWGIGNGIPWTNGLESAYSGKTAGRDIRLWLPLILDEDSDGKYARARFDYFDVISDFYAGFYENISNWLAEHNMYYTGHFWEESLQRETSCAGDNMKGQRAFSMPGNDALNSSIYDPHDSKEAQSVAEFDGKRYMNELLGAGDMNIFDPKLMKEAVNCAIAYGFNHIINHGVFMTRTFKGSGWLPDWFDQNPWWNVFDTWTGFVRRASYLNSQGQVNPDVLLYSPNASAMVLLGQNDKIFWSSLAGHVGYIDDLYSQEVKDINTVYSNAIRELTKHRIEYLIADNYYMKKMTQSGNNLAYGNFNFKSVVLPKMAVMSLPDAQKIVNFAKAGGYVYSLGNLPRGSVENGMGDPEMASLMTELKSCSNYKAVSNIATTLNAKPEGLKSPVQFVSGEFAMLQHRRKIDGNDFFWLTNNNSVQQKCVVYIEGVSGEAQIWNCETGEKKSVASAGGQVSLTFEPHEAYFLEFGSNLTGAGTPVLKFDEKLELMNVTDWKVRVDTSAQPNVEFAVTIDPSLLTPEGKSKLLTDWTNWTELSDNFTGSVDYSATINLSAIEKDTIEINLGKVNHFAEVWVNDTYLGARLWAPHSFYSNAFVNGTNRIKVRVGNLVNNQYGSDYRYSASGLIGPVKILKKSSPVNTDLDLSIKNSQIKLFPNPCKGSESFTITGVEAESVTIVDIFGKIVRKVENKSSDISVRGLKSGEYRVRILADGITYTKQLLIL